MREILFRGKSVDTGKWVNGYYEQKLNPYTENGEPRIHMILDIPPFGAAVYPDTVGQYTGLTDKSGKKIFEGDIVQYLNHPMDDDFDCQSVIRFGEYPQDGSGGEYNPTLCAGWFVEVNNFTCPDWANNDPSFFHNYDSKRSLLDVKDRCEIIGNIHDNPELLIGG